MDDIICEMQSVLHNEMVEI